jgi:hypothetical protein
MNLQLQRIQHACEVLKLSAIATEWSAIADHSAAQGKSFADYLERDYKIFCVSGCLS